jgi:uncharacterized repeat protein (TIGR02543 family)
MATTNHYNASNIRTQQFRNTANSAGQLDTNGSQRRNVTYHANGQIREQRNYEFVAGNRRQPVNYLINDINGLRLQNRDFRVSGQELRNHYQFGVRYRRQRINRSNGAILYTQWLCINTWQNTECDPSQVNRIVAFNANGGTGRMASLVVPPNATRSLPANAFTRGNNHSFRGWATTQARANAGTVDFANGAQISPTGNMTLFAVWQATSRDQFMITFMPNGGTGNRGPVVTNANGIVSPPQNTFVRQCYTFVGWSTEDDIALAIMESVTTSFTMPATDVTVKANWLLNEIDPQEETVEPKEHKTPQTGDVSILTLVAVMLLAGTGYCLVWKKKESETKTITVN